jgi:hypothetical protein
MDYESVSESKPMDPKPKKNLVGATSVADPECFIPDPGIFSSRIPDPTSYVKRG